MSLHKDQEIISINKSASFFLESDLFSIITSSSNNRRYFVLLPFILEEVNNDFIKHSSNKYLPIDVITFKNKIIKQLNKDIK